MIRLALFFYFWIGIIYSGQAQEKRCSIQFYSKIIVADQATEYKFQDLTALIEKSDCPETIGRKVIAPRDEENRSALGLKDKMQLRLAPLEITHNADAVSVINLEDELNKRVNSANELQHKVSQVQLLAPRQFLVLSDQESYQIVPLRESQTYKLTILRPIGEQVYWVSAKMKTKTAVLKAITNIPMSSQMDLTTLFTATESYEEHPERYFTQADLLSYFNLTRHIEQGHLLLVNDLSSKLLIQNNQIIKVELNLNNLTISTTAVAKQSGKRGDFITLSTLDGKKRIVGKIIDFNQVQVQL